MLETILMKRFKIFLLLLILPISYFVYHLIGFDGGVNAYYEKINMLNIKKNRQNDLITEINYYKNKIKLLEPNNIDIDYLEEKSFETLGNSEEGNYTIILK